MDAKKLAQFNGLRLVQTSDQEVVIEAQGMEVPTLAVSLLMKALAGESE